MLIPVPQLINPYEEKMEIPIHVMQDVGYNGLMPIQSSNSVVADLLEPVSSALNADAAKKLLKVRYKPKTQARVAQLARKCNEGQLTEPERHEYELYVLTGEIVALLQAKSRSLLAGRSAS